MRIKLHPEEEKRIRQMATRSGHFDERFYSFMIDRATKVVPAQKRRFEWVDMTPIKYDRPDLETQRKKAAEFLVKNYSREERYLIILSRDINGAVDAFKKNTFKTPEKREQKRWDLLFDFRTLISRKSEYKWSVRKLLENGIDFFAVKTLINSLFSAQELAS